MRRIDLTTLSISLADEPPTEIRLLRFGLNRSTKGTFGLTREGAQGILTAWRDQNEGIDRPGMIDLEHLSLNPDASNFDPDSRAWFDIELREDGLYMVDIRWTADGADRVKQRKQRFLSPAFSHSNGEIDGLYNVGLTSLPALYSAPELIAARADGEDMDENDKALGAILKALGIDPKMPEKVSSALGLEAGASIDDIRAALDSFAEKMAKVEELLSGEAAAEEPAAEEPVVEASETPPPEEEEEVIAARKDVSDELVTLRAFKAAQEEKERKSLVVAMIKAGAEDPATAWTDDTATTVAEPWASMGLVALRNRVAKLSSRRAVVKPPTTPAGELSESQLAICKEYNLDPARFAQLRAQAGRK